ncbi:hypothetical protein FQA47_003777 [Oryzias melastigma]|uniref:Uncharacterized protein n=1 Tax=Oryzias melastigma TaxID=30732 RepID=A0A834FG05_ORYME|nr:hypothetical protein FQA47_003777 [Oryzias melastigma]
MMLSHPPSPSRGRSAPVTDFSTSPARELGSRLNKRTAECSVTAPGTNHVLRPSQRGLLGSVVKIVALFLSNNVPDLPVVEENPAHSGGFAFGEAKLLKAAGVGSRPSRGAAAAGVESGLVTVAGLLWERDVTPQDRARRQTKGGKRQEGGSVVSTEAAGVLYTGLELGVGVGSGPSGVASSLRGSAASKTDGISEDPRSSPRSSGYLCRSSGERNGRVLTTPRSPPSPPAVPEAPLSWETELLPDHLHKEPRIS